MMSLENRNGKGTVHKDVTACGSDFTKFSGSKAPQK